MQQQENQELKKVRQKLKHSKLIKYIIPAAVILITALPGYCAQSVSIKQTAIKFLLAMGGVALSSFIIFAGLTFYNKFFVERKYIKFNKEDSLSTPENVDDAINFFIRKNKLR